MTTLSSTPYTAWSSRRKVNAVTMKRYRVSWSNFPGAPGVSTHYVDPAVTDFSPIRVFYQAVALCVPNALTFNFPTSVDVIDETNGQIQTTQAATVLSSLNSIVASAAFSGTSGCAVQWRTPDYVNGNHVVGRTYVVPLAQTQYDTNGSIASGTVTNLQAAGMALIAAMPMLVWHRPKPGVPGSKHAVTNVAVPDLAVVMRSRRI